jgi:hypothetical protein
MIIGLTYDLRQDYLDRGYSALETAEFDSVETIDAIAQALADLGHTPVRIGNAKELTGRLVGGERWDLCSTLPKACTAWAEKPRCRPSWTCTRSPILFQTRW